MRLTFGQRFGDPEQPLLDEVLCLGQVPDDQERGPHQAAT
jgi:hypothetical protein